MFLERREVNIGDSAREGVDDGDDASVGRDDLNNLSIRFEWVKDRVIWRSEPLVLTAC